MKTYDVLEISISRVGQADHAGQYLVRGHYYPADDAADDTRVEAHPSTFDQEVVDDDDDRERDLGSRLTDFLFGKHKELSQLFEQALDDAAGKYLRLRLVIGTSAQELHEQPWELLENPQNGRRLLLDERILFSRFMFASEGRPASARPPTDPTAAILVASPDDLAAYGDEDDPPAPVDDRFGSSAKDALQRWRFDIEPAPATMDTFAKALRKRPDVLYLVCHGLRTREGSVLLLEDSKGHTDAVTTVELVDKMIEIGHLPRLVVLGSCSSAGEQDASSVRAELGPLLCRIGVPAVLAMRGRVSQETARVFLAAFFSEMAEHGQIDLAMAVARRRVADRDDWSAPTLFTRLRSARLFARASADTSFEKWPALLRAIRRGQCVPVIGPGLSEWMCGSRSDMAYRLSRDFGFPLAWPQRGDLPPVAQFLSVHQNQGVLRDQVRRKLWDSLITRFGGSVELAPSDDEQEDRRLLDDALHQVALTQRWAHGDAEPHLVLAELPFPLYLSTEPFDLMARALEHSQRSDVIRAHYQWRVKDDFEDPIAWPTDLLNPGPEQLSDTGLAPEVHLDKDRPIVVHLFGSLGVPNSVTLTEDEYFEWMLGYDTEANPKLHSTVTEALTWPTLLFLGFRIDDWDLRVLLRVIQRFEGGPSRREVPHLAVQIDPDEDRTVRPDRARKYLEELLDVADVHVYWGSTEAFCRQLHDEANKTAPASGGSR